MNALVVQRIEQFRPKEEMGVQFPPRAPTRKHHLVFREIRVFRRPEEPSDVGLLLSFSCQVSIFLVHFFPFLAHETRSSIDFCASAYSDGFSSRFHLS